MKLLVQSDDYGITPAVASGIIYGIKHGIVKNTGLFANMPWAEECVDMIRPYLDEIGFGIDLNASTGPSILGYQEVPSLCHENNAFLTSKENKALDTEENNHDHVIYDEVYKEFDAQVQRYIQLVGKVPDYIHGHAYATPTIWKASRDIAKKYNREYTIDFLETHNIKSCDMSYYRFGTDLEAQMKDDIKDYLVNRSEFLKEEKAFIVSHCGYVDEALFNLSSYTFYRMKDLAALTDSEVLDWVKSNHIELIRYQDLY